MERGGKYLVVKAGLIGEKVAFLVIYLRVKVNIK